MDILDKKGKLRKERKRRLTHGDAQEADDDLDTSDDVEGLDDAPPDDPIVGAPSEGEAEHVLEDQERGEGFHRDITCSIFPTQQKSEITHW